DRLAKPWITRPFPPHRIDLRQISEQGLPRHPCLRKLASEAKNHCPSASAIKTCSRHKDSQALRMKAEQGPQIKAHALQAARYSTLKPAAFTTGPQRAISASTKALAFSESESVIASRPEATSTFWNS